MAIASFALTAATQVMSFKAAQQQADAQAYAQAQSNAAQIAMQNNQIAAWQDAVASAGKSLADQTHQEDTRMNQVRDQAVDKQIDLLREAAQARGTALASSESGGLSEELLLADIERQREMYSERVSKNVENEALQSYWIKTGMVSDAQSRANATKPTFAPTSSYRPQSGPSGASLGIGVAGAALDSYNMFHIKNPKGDIKTA
jgi:hypothetical protein